MRKRDLTPIGIHRKGNVIRHVGKGATEQHLGAAQPRQTLTGGTPDARSISDYAKASPLPPTLPPGDSALSMSNE